MPQKKHIAILCGGQSAEHEVSIQSAKNIIQALDVNRYQISTILITLQGEWLLLDSPAVILNNPDMQPLPTPVAGQRLVFNFGSEHPLTVQASQAALAVDVIFPVLHGAHGEDGTLQGLLELANIPYVGAGTLGSAVCMDKEVTKHLLMAANIPVARWLTVRQLDLPNLNYDEVVAQLGSPLFVKPANTGSSVGVSKVKNRDDFAKALQLAQQYDRKIIIEEFIPGREIECAVLGNEEPKASLPGEIIPKHEFYSYEAKYLDPDGAELKMPANLPAAAIANIQDLAKRAFVVLGCSGMARVDFFFMQDGRAVLNEANTIPGFTQISMYPQMWVATGMTYSGLIDKLIELGLERFEKERVLVLQSGVAARKGL
ncbi:MAG TPA: D-alanine--D-alanine ligase family protein [Gammaproteobacteria bacterium]|nr:D-alanine--D-alanine ligase family protein [Gammaproteobacteria bacterium]